MKRVLVLSLVLVMALAGIAYADAVKWSGEFVSEIANNGKDFGSNLEVDSTLTINVDVETEGASWSLDVESALSTTGFNLGKYKLTVDDEYFDLYFWGNGAELSDKSTTLGLIAAGKKETDHRARLVVDAIEPVTVTADFSNKALRMFVDADIAGYEAGLAYKRKGEKGIIADDNVKNTIGLWGKADVDIVTLQGDIGATLLEKDVALGYAAKATAHVTDELDIWVKYAGMQDDFDAESDWPMSKVSIGGEYDDGSLKADASFAYDIDGESNTVEASATYRFSDTLAYNDLFKADKYYTNDAPAAKVSLTLNDFEFGKVRGDVASPVVEDLVWAKAYAEYGKYKYDDEEKSEEAEDTGFEVGADVYVQATEKLALKPFAGYKSIGQVISVGAEADYDLGGPTLTVGVKYGRAEDIRASERAESIYAKVTVEF